MVTSRQHRLNAQRFINGSKGQGREKFTRYKELFSNRRLCFKRIFVPLINSRFFKAKEVYKKGGIMIYWKEVINFAKNGNPTPDKRVEKTEIAWLKMLSPEAFRITRKKGTERSFTGELCKVYEPGEYACICCDTKLFDSSVKYDSGTGWPSFSQPIQENAIKYELDSTLGMTRVEVMCNTCDAHLGHVFKYGPKPSGLRYCINSVSLKYIDNDKKN